MARLLPVVSQHAPGRYGPILEEELGEAMSNVPLSIRGRSQLSTFMKAYREYARGRGSGTIV